MKFSDEYAGMARFEAPQMADGCPNCTFFGALAPYATEPARRGTGTTAFYRHRACGFQWVTNWLTEPSPGWGWLP